jgi:hypothetical protein
MWFGSGKRNNDVLGADPVAGGNGSRRDLLLSVEPVWLSSTLAVRRLPALRVDALSGCLDSRDGCLVVLGHEVVDGATVTSTSGRIGQSL